VKTAFEKFGGMLDKAQKNIRTGLDQLEDVVGKRTRATQRQLRDVESLPVVGEENILGEVVLEVVGRRSRKEFDNVHNR